MKRELCKEALVRELYITRVQTMWLGVPDNQNEHTTRWNKRQHYRRHVGITTGVMTRSLSVVDGDHAGYDTTLAATQVGRRRVDEAATTVFRGVDEMVNTHHSAIKQGRVAWSELGAFSRFTEVS